MGVSKINPNSVAKPQLNERIGKFNDPIAPDELNYCASGVFRYILLAGRGPSWQRLKCISKGVSREILQ